MFALVLLGVGGLLVALSMKSEPAAPKRAPRPRADGPPPAPPGPEIPHVEPIETPHDERDLGDFNAWELPNPMSWRLEWDDRLGLFGDWYVPSTAHDGHPPVAGESLYQNPMYAATYSLRGSGSSGVVLEGIRFDVRWAPWTYPPEEGGHTVLRQLLLIHPGLHHPDDWIEIGQEKYTYMDVWSESQQGWILDKVEYDEPLHQFLLLGPE